MSTQTLILRNVKVETGDHVLGDVALKVQYLSRVSWALMTFRIADCEFAGGAERCEA